MNIYFKLHLSRENYNFCWANCGTHIVYGLTAKTQKQIMLTVVGDKQTEPYLITSHLDKLILSVQLLPENKVMWCKVYNSIISSIMKLLWSFAYWWMMCNLCNHAVAASHIAYIVHRQIFLSTRKYFCFSPSYQGCKPS